MAGYYSINDGTMQNKIVNTKRNIVKNNRYMHDRLSEDVEKKISAELKGFSSHKRLKSVSHFRGGGGFE